MSSSSRARRQRTRTSVPAKVPRFTLTSFHRVREAGGGIWTTVAVQRGDCLYRKQLLSHISPKLLSGTSIHVVLPFVLTSAGAVKLAPERRGFLEAEPVRQDELTRAREIQRTAGLFVHEPEA
jgi:hypothetical protein